VKDFIQELKGYAEAGSLKKEKIERLVLQRDFNMV